MTAREFVIVYGLAFIVGYSLQVNLPSFAEAPPPAEMLVPPTPLGAIQVKWDGVHVLDDTPSSNAYATTDTVVYYAFR